MNRAFPATMNRSRQTLVPYGTTCGTCPVLLVFGLMLWTGARAQEARVVVHADQPGHVLSPLLTGACIEDVNHEIYGGLYSQMIFGESFQEPPPAVPPRGFLAFGGRWTVANGVLEGSAGDGPQLASDLPSFKDGEVSVEVRFADRTPGNAGLIVRLDRPGVGADNFDGYEVSLDPAGQLLRLGRHRHNWELIRDTPCEVPVAAWTRLTVRLSGRVLEALVNDRVVIRHEDDARALLSGGVGLRQWQREAQYRDLQVKLGGEPRQLPFEPPPGSEQQVSGMWRSFQRGTAVGRWAVEPQMPFVGAQSQRLDFVSGRGEVGIENQGLNRWGLAFQGGQRYEGVLWARAAQATDLCVALEAADGGQVHLEQSLPLAPGGWQRLEFSLIPPVAEPRGRFAIKLRQPGSVTLGYVSLQPGAWGRFKDLPVRRDVAEALIAEGITVLRYGGSMVNHPEYRWKRMIGPRDRRPPYRGTWYPYSSNGWGIPDFMAFCEAAEFEYIPAFNLEETPQDMADFIAYAKDPPNTEWGRHRAADGHPAPFRLRYLELGNEERVDDAYAARFETLAQAIWTRDPEIILVVGDFVYGERITDPDHLRGAASGITSLSGQRQILRFAKQHEREVWFDVHVGTDGPRPDATLDGMFSFRDALDRIADGARHRVVVFELNAGNHSQRRALANALALHAVLRDGRIPIVTSANGLQPDGENDNGWDQGLLFLNPSQVWLQPPGYVTQMLARNLLPRSVPCDVLAPAGALDVVAQRSEDGRSLVLQAVNSTSQPVSARLELPGFAPSQPLARVTTLGGPLEARNMAAQTNRIIPRYGEWAYGSADGVMRYSFESFSVTALRFE